MQSQKLQIVADDLYEQMLKMCGVRLSPNWEISLWRSPYWGSSVDVYVKKGHAQRCVGTVTVRLDLTTDEFIYTGVYYSNVTSMAAIIQERKEFTGRCPEEIISKYIETLIAKND
jgi:hypothetical protein